MDPYLALTPVLVLGIIGLIRFIGCNQFFDLDETHLRVDPIADLVPQPADQRVILTWTYPSTINGTIFKIDVSGGPFDQPPDLDASARGAEITGLTNGTVYTFSVVAEHGSDASDPVSTTSVPGVTSFVDDDPPISGMTRNDYGGWLGMEIVVGAMPVIVTQLGRIIGPNNSGTHPVKIVSPATTPGGAPVDGNDLVSVNVITTAAPGGSNVGTFAWQPLPQPFTLLPNTIYFVMSLETAGGDLWFNEQPLPTTGVATIQFATVVRLTNPDIGKYQRSGAGQVFVPVSFRY